MKMLTKAKPRRQLRYATHITVLAFIVLVLAACRSDSQPDTSGTGSLPTRTLVPPTVTPTPTPTITPGTPPPTDLPGPSALRPATAIPTPEPHAEQVIVTQALEHLLTTQPVERDDIRLMSLESFVWRDEAWECQLLYEAGYTDFANVPGYRVVFNAGSRVFVYHTDTHGRVRLCRDAQWLRQHGEPLITDPIAEAMVERSRRDAARRFDTPDTALELVSVLTLTWPDASLGCPKTGAEYDNRETPGYRIVFETGDAQAIYHTSVQDIVFCTPEEELLPGVLRRALP